MKAAGGSTLLKNRKDCPLCGSADLFQFRAGNVDPTSLTPDDFRITDSRYGLLWPFRRCRACSFVFADPVVPAEKLKQFYADLQDSDYGREEQGRSRIFKRILRRLKKILQVQGSLLDIGAANGLFMHLAAGAGFQVTGIEPSTALAAEGRERYGLEILPLALQDFQTEVEFQVITLLDILEHLEDPGRVVARVNRLLAPGGLLVIVTPDINSLAARIMGRRWWHNRIAHVNFFCLRSLERLLTDRGFEILSRKRYAWHFSPFYILTRLMPGLGGSRLLRRLLGSFTLPLQLFDSWEVYARKKT